MDSFLSSQVQKLQNKMILGFISNFKSRLPRHNGLTPLQRSCPGGRNPYHRGLHGIVSKTNKSKTLVHNTPSTNNTQKIPVHGKINFESSTHPNLISLSRTGSLTTYLSTHVIEFIIRPPNCYQISLDLTDSNFVQIWTSSAQSSDDVEFSNYKSDSEDESSKDTQTGDEDEDLLSLPICAKDISVVENGEDEYLTDHNPNQRCENFVPSSSKGKNLCERVASLEQSMVEIVAYVREEKLRRSENNKKKKAPTIDDEILSLAIADDDLVAVDEYFTEEVAEEIKEEEMKEEEKEQDDNWFL
uniref:Uncharacterized protein n=1 Tax=Solanum tuberosum TaxID=4113 RepID=M1DJJ5_SOLTU